MPTLRTSPWMLSIICSVLAIPALGQSQGSDQPNTKEKLDFVELAEEPFHLDSVGLSVRLPVGAIAQSGSGQSGVRLGPPLGKGNWTILIDVRQTSNKDATIVEAAEQAIASLQTAYGTVDRDRTVVTETYAEILDRSKGLIVNGSPAERFYMSLPAGPGSKAGEGETKREIRGFTFFKPTSTDYVIFELQCPQAEYRNARHIYETMMATASFEAASTVALERGTAIVAGSRFFDALTHADYINAMGITPGQDDGPEIAYRLYEPATSGGEADATEHGYRFVKFWRGKRGQLDPSLSPASYTATEKQEGLLARVRGRVLTPMGTGDTEGIYFMAPDRSEEAWSVRTVVHGSNNKVIASASETGARSGNALTVVINEGGRSRTVQPVLQGRGEGYISQVESYLLPRLFMLKKVPGEYGFYSYQSQSETVSLRRDTLAQDPESAGAWTLETAFRESSATTGGGVPQKSIYADDGRLVRTTLEGGRLWEPIEAERLMELWKKKGLPTGSGK